MKNLYLGQMSLLAHSLMYPKSCMSADIALYSCCPEISPRGIMCAGMLAS